MYENLKKKYGQNFLIDRNILKKISGLINKKNLKIIEIGPGNGALTEFILKFEPKKIKLIEIDKDLIVELNSKFSDSNIEIIHFDILKYKFDENFDLIISNLPYNISSQIISKICLSKILPDKLILMFQKEFADRLLDKKLNSINSLVNCFYDINKKFHVSRNCFRPIPKIDSTVLLFSKKKKLLLNYDEKENFIFFKRNVFSQKRKTLKKVLKNFTIQDSKVNLSLRVEDLSLESLILLFRDINYENS